MGVKSALAMCDTRVAVKPRSPFWQNVRPIVVQTLDHFWFAGQTRVIFF